MALHLSSCTRQVVAKRGNLNEQICNLLESMPTRTLASERNSAIHEVSAYHEARHVRMRFPLLLSSCIIAMYATFRLSIVRPEELALYSPQKRQAERAGLLCNEPNLAHS